MPHRFAHTSTSISRLFALISILSVPLPACSSEDGGDPNETGDGDGDEGDGDVGDGDVAAGDGDGDQGDGDGDGSGGGTTGGMPSGIACERDARLGSFLLILTEDYTTFRGSVSNGVAPNGVPEVKATSGACSLLGAPNLFCATPCENGTLCAGDDQCVPTPMKVSAGTVSVSGTATPISEDPNGITLDYNETINDPYPAFNSGDALTLSAAGDEADAFSLSGEGVGLMTTSASTVELVESQPIELSWDATGASDNSTVEIELTVNAHGGTPAWISCETEDTGSFSIPADIVGQLVDLGLSGFPRVSLTRQTVDSTELSTGCVDFTVTSGVTLDVSIDGLVSCSDTSDCPDGQTCNEALICE